MLSNDDGKEMCLVFDIEVHIVLICKNPANVYNIQGFLRYRPTLKGKQYSLIRSCLKVRDFRFVVEIVDKAVILIVCYSL